MRKKIFCLAWMIGLLAIAAKADNLVVVTNGAGIYYSGYAGMAFTDANGNYVFIGGTQHFVEIFYNNGAYLRFPYDPVTHIFSGTDETGNFTAVVHENLATIHRGGGGGRGDGYPGYRTVVTGGEIDYFYVTGMARLAPGDKQ